MKEINQSKFVNEFDLIKIKERLEKLGKKIISY